MAWSTNVMRNGHAEAPAEWHTLRAGPLTAILEGGDLRYLRAGDHEVLRRVYVAVRDRTWGTVAPVYTHMSIQERADSFAVSFDAEHRAGEIDFAWHGAIRGTAQGTITYSMEGEARSSFFKNRIGLCVLHPMACAGARCTVLKAGGDGEDGTFPDLITPHQPFLDLVGITHEVAPGVWAQVHLEGEVFEMEDQRNWTDASFKTYSTPLRLPYPVKIERGTRVQQRLTLFLQGAPSTGGPAADSLPRFTVEPRAVAPLPRIGLGMASHGRPLSAPEVARLRVLRPAHLRVDLVIDDAGLAERVSQAAAEAAALAAPLEVALHVPSEEQEARAGLARVRETLEQERVRTPVARWLVFPREGGATSESLARLAREVLAGYDAHAAIGGGSDAYFTHINRQRPPTDLLDVVSYSINPQAHAFDDASLVETLPTQAETLRSARAFSGERPLAISPLTLRPRFNPDASGPREEPRPGELPPSVDPRQMALFGAAWTAGSLKYVAEGGAESATYYETTGWRGLMETAEGAPLAEIFPSQPGMLFPVYHVLADVAEFAGGEVLGTTTTDALRVDGLALRRAGRVRLLLANLRGEPCEVEVRGVSAPAARVRCLDEQSFVEAALDGTAFRAREGEARTTEGCSLRLTLRPYAVARIDWPEV